MKERQSISIREISKLSGVSIATVSRVVNNQGKVSEKTRQRVLGIIEQYHYVPDMVAKGMRTKSMPTIAIIVPDILIEFYGLLVHTIQKTMLEHSIMSIVCCTDENPETTQLYIDILRAQRVSGIIYVPDSHAGTLQIGDLPVVYVDRRPHGIIPFNCAVVECDNRHGGYLATKELLEKGCKRIVVFVDPFQLSNHQQRYLGYCDALLEYGLKPDPTLVLCVDPLYSTEAMNTMAEFLRKGIPFDGIFSTAGRITLGIIGALRKANIDMPQDVKLVGFDDFRMCDYEMFPLTAIRQPTEEMACSAASLLIDLIHKCLPEEPLHILPVSFIRRGTT
jgi:LacI family transcriptional regulator